jgi:hypothetical protein
MVLIVRFVVFLADQAHASAHTFFTFKCQEQDILAMVEQHILFWVEIFPFIHVQRRYPIGVILVYFGRKMNKKTQVFFVFDNSDSYGHRTKIKKVLIRNKS